MTENDRVREIRKAKSLTLEKFGEKIGMGKSAVSEIERGRNSLSNQARHAICREFNVNEEWLRTGDGEMFIPLDPSEELAGFLGDVMKENEGFKMRLISVLARLSPDEWELLERMALKLAEDVKKGDP